MCKYSIPVLWYISVVFVQLGVSGDSLSTRSAMNGSENTLSANSIRNMTLLFKLESSSMCEEQCSFELQTRFCSKLPEMRTPLASESTKNFTIPRLGGFHTISILEMDSPHVSLDARVSCSAFPGCTASPTSMVIWAGQECKNREAAVPFNLLNSASNSTQPVYLLSEGRPLTVVGFNRTVYQSCFAELDRCRDGLLDAVSVGVDLESSARNTDSRGRLQSSQKSKSSVLSWLARCAMVTWIAVCPVIQSLLRPMIVC